MRHYGFLSNRAKEQQLPRCRALLGQAETTAVAVPATAVALLLGLTGQDVTCCPQCGQGHMVRVQRLLKKPRPPVEGGAVPAANSS